MRRGLFVLLLLLVATGFLASTHYYLALRLVLDPELAQPWRGLALGAIAALGASLVLLPLAERRLPRAQNHVDRLALLLWIGFASANDRLFASDLCSGGRADGGGRRDFRAVLGPGGARRSCLARLLAGWLARSGWPRRSCAASRSSGARPPPRRLSDREISESTSSALRQFPARRSRGERAPPRSGR